MWSEVLRHDGGTPAAVIFSDTIEQVLWQRDEPEENRVRLIAGVRLRLRLGPTKQAARRAG